MEIALYVTLGAFLTLSGGVIASFVYMARRADKERRNMMEIVSTTQRTTLAALIARHINDPRVSAAAVTKVLQGQIAERTISREAPVQPDTPKPASEAVEVSGGLE